MLINVLRNFSALLLFVTLIFPIPTFSQTSQPPKKPEEAKVIDYDLFQCQSGEIIFVEYISYKEEEIDRVEFSLVENEFVFVVVTKDGAWIFEKDGFKFYKPSDLGELSPCEFARDIKKATL